MINVNNDHIDPHPRREDHVPWDCERDNHAQTVFPATATPDEIAAQLGDPLLSSLEADEYWTLNRICWH